MARIGPKNTKPEMIVRRTRSRMGFRFRLHKRSLPGTPDLVLPAHKLAIFVHGCFWHRHPGCRLASTPKTRTEFWEAKFHANVERDARKLAELERSGWTTAVLWECETRDLAQLEARLSEMLPAQRKGAGS